MFAQEHGSRWKQCLPENKPENIVKPLKLKHVAPAFVLIGVGCTLTILVFVLEIITICGRKILRKK